MASLVICSGINSRRGPKYGTPCGNSKWVLNNVYYCKHHLDQQPKQLEPDNEPDTLASWMSKLKLTRARSDTRSTSSMSELEMEYYLKKMI